MKRNARFVWRKQESELKKLVLILALMQVSFAHAASMSLTKFVPRNSFIVIGADFDSLRTNDVFAEMERKGHVWSQDEDSDFKHYLQLLKIDPQRDIQTFVLAKYVNSYGNKGELYILSLNRSLKPQLEGKSYTEYLGTPMFRIDNPEESYASEIGPDTVVLGNLKEVKMAIDVSRAKSPPLSQNVMFQRLLQKVPQTAAVWGASVPFSRKEAATLGIDQSTNAVLQAFEHYFFYGIPKRKTVDAFFVGQATGEKEGAFVRTFMIGTLTFAKLRVEDNVADMLDQIEVNGNGKQIEVTAVITKEMVDAYLEGDLGVE